MKFGEEFRVPDAFALLMGPAGMVGVAVIVTAALLAAFAACWRMAHSRARALSQLRDAIDAMPDAFGFFDEADRLVLWNAPYAEINPALAPHLRYGITFSEIMKIAIERGLYPDAAPDPDAWLARRMQTRRGLGSTLEVGLNDGRRVRIQERRAATGGVVTLITDITELKRSAEALEDARDAAEAANRAKSQFLANMSHEIRTPLNGVMGVAEALGRTGLKPPQREMLDLIHSSGRSLQALLSDILDLARIESGRLEMGNEPFELAVAIRESAALYEAQAREKGLAFNLDIDLSACVWAVGDAVRLKQVLTNLVSNAVKFTAIGMVGLSAAVRREGTAATLRISVEDTGIGFDAETRSRLFGRFEQADGAITRQFGGSGLGLAICRQLVEMMGGDLDCESEPGGGSVFILTLPLQVVAAPPVIEPDTDQQSRIVRRPTVLLADDHPINRKVVELILGPSDVDLTVVENGVEALEAYRGERWDLVLMDMQMPIMDGLTATREIRLLEQRLDQSPTPIVMLTANALPEHVAAAREAGADRHLSKPFSAEALLEVLADAMLQSDLKDAA